MFFVQLFLSVDKVLFPKVVQGSREVSVFSPVPSPPPGGRSCHVCSTVGRLKPYAPRPLLQTPRRSPLEIASRADRWCRGIVGLRVWREHVVLLTDGPGTPSAPRVADVGGAACVGTQALRNPSGGCHGGCCRPRRPPCGGGRCGTLGVARRGRACVINARFACAEGKRCCRRPSRACG